MLGTVDPESFDTLHSYANAFEMPFVTPWFPESTYNGPREAAKQEFAIQIRPDYHAAITDLVTYYNWDKIIYIYRLQSFGISSFLLCQKSRNIKRKNEE